MFHRASFHPTGCPTGPYQCTPACSKRTLDNSHAHSSQGIERTAPWQPQPMRRLCSVPTRPPGKS
jgi:hypothetical protein